MARKTQAKTFASCALPSHRARLARACTTCRASPSASLGSIPYFVSSPLVFTWIRRGHEAQMDVSPLSSKSAEIGWQEHTFVFGGQLTAMEAAYSC